MIQGTAPIKKEFTTMKKLYYASTNNKTLFFPSAVSLIAKTHPAEPAPMIIKSNSSIICL